MPSGDGILNTGTDFKHGTAHNKEWAEGRRVAEAEPHQHQFGGCELLPPSVSCDISAGGDSRLHEPIPPGCLPQSFPKHSSCCCRTGLRPQAFHCFQGHSLCSGAEKQNCLSFTVYVYQIHAARFFFFSFGSVFCAVLRERSEAIFYLLQNSK